MARKKKESAPAPAPTPEKVRPSEVRKMPSGALLKKLIREARGIQEEMAEKVGEHRNNIKAAQENQNLHKGALAIAKRFDKMEPEKLADLWDHLNHYMEVLGHNTRIQSVARMDFGDGSDATEGEDGADADADNVHRFPSADTAH